MSESKEVQEDEFKVTWREGVNFRIGRGSLIIIISTMIFALVGLYFIDKEILKIIFEFFK